MSNFSVACEKAQKSLIRQGYKKGFGEICDLGDKWLFIGRRFEIGVVDYGNCPVAVDKQNGQCKNFPLSILENYDAYYESETVEIPEEYIIKD